MAAMSFALILARDSSLESSERLFIEYDIEEGQMVRSNNEFVKRRKSGNTKKQKNHVCHEFCSEFSAR